MIIDSSSAAGFRVVIMDQGLSGAADELRHHLLDARLARLLPWPMPDGAAADVLVLTWSGEGELGYALAAARRVAPEAAVVVVIPHYDEATFIEAIRQGADDCLTAAQIDAPGILRVLLLANERHRVSSSLRAAAFTDELTGLYNRRGYVTRASSLLRVADPKMVWQIFFDVDELKIINDTFGHWAGDRALMEVAAVLRQAFRASDIVARVGGDEFAVLAVAPADAAPESWTARWREPFTALANRRDLPLSVSVGLAQPDENGSMTPDDLLTRADTTMYTAKRLRKKLVDNALKQSSFTASAR